MSMDTPATIAILGAGPVGLETGLYARYLGYDVVMYERDEIAANVLRWGHLPMFSPFSELRSPLGIASLRAQDTDYQTPASDSQLTGRQWVDRYLLPLSRTDLLADHIVCGATVRSITRDHCRKTDRNQDEARKEDGFRILVEHADGSESIESADLVIDTTGVYGQGNWSGAGGIPARGERRLRSRIEYQVPDITGRERAQYEARRVLVIGSGLSAATTIVALAQTIKQVPETHVTWVTHAKESEQQTGPIVLDRIDDQPQIQSLVEAAHQCLHAGDPHLVHQPGRSITSIDFDAATETFSVWFDTDAEPHTFDRIVANVGYRGDSTLYEELQVRAHERTGGPWGIGERLDRAVDARGAQADEHSESQCHPTDSLVTTEPHFYILGAKSYGRDSRFRMSAGYDQIRDLFSIIGGRAGLDLYATMTVD